MVFFPRHLSLRAGIACLCGDCNLDENTLKPKFFKNWYQCIYYHSQSGLLKKNFMYIKRKVFKIAMSLIVAASSVEKLAVACERSGGGGDEEAEDGSPSLPKKNTIC